MQTFILIFGPTRLLYVLYFGHICIMYYLITKYIINSSMTLEISASCAFIEYVHKNVINYRYLVTMFNWPYYIAKNTEPILMKLTKLKDTIWQTNNGSPWESRMLKNKQFFTYRLLVFDTYEYTMGVVDKHSSYWIR